MKIRYLSVHVFHVFDWILNSFGECPQYESQHERIRDWITTSEYLYMYNCDVLELSLVDEWMVMDAINSVETSTSHTLWFIQAVGPHWLETLGCPELNVDASYGN